MQYLWRYIVLHNFFKSKRKNFTPLRNGKMSYICPVKKQIARNIETYGKDVKLIAC